MGKYTRSRVQQIVEEAGPPSKPTSREWIKDATAQKQLTDFLRSYVDGWPRQEPTPFGVPVATSIADYNTPEVIAADLVSKAEFRAISSGPG